MNQNFTLVILAAGMGSRFGGLKQIEPVGPSNEFIIDYSIYDAIKAGFNKVVFLIREEHYDIFRETIGSRIEKNIKVEYAFQKNDNAPLYKEELQKREKPLGTAHAILCCKDKVKEPFMMINADDFYGEDAFKVGIEYLKNINSKEIPHQYGLVGYKVANTISENGSVKRGICNTNNNYLVNITESVVEKINNKIIATPLNEKEKPFEVKENDIVSMNMLLFDTSIFNYIEEEFKNFLEYNKDNLEKCEYLIPDILFKTVNEKKAICKIIKTSAKWYGITYKEDLPELKEAINKMIEQGLYKESLWEK